MSELILSDRNKSMIIGTIGLGLIGGSMARAYRAYSDENGANFEIYAAEKNTSILDFSILSGVVDGVLDEETIPKCDVIFLALYPEATVEYMKSIAHLIDRDAIVMDLCGTKAQVCRVGFELAEKYGFTFVGGHPMAGTQYSGYKHSRSNMFKGAPMVIVPPRYDDMALLERIKSILSPAGFGKYTVSSPEEHDAMIAFTSQLAHIVSNAYVKSPTAEKHKGFSAGSYKDMTRVAWLNEDMWTELFFDNKEPLIYELDTIINSLCEYRDTLKLGDREKMTAILRDGRIAKECIDGDRKK